MNTVLVVGGAGYIGSVTANCLVEKGYDVTVLDNLDRGHITAVPRGANFVQGDIRDRDSLVSALSALRPDCVVHFAALAYVGESFERTPEYLDINIGGTASLLAAMQQCDVGNIVFSSSCTVYGVPLTLPISEDEPVKPPISPYGFTKQMCEQMLEWSRSASGLSFGALRYFNAAGAWKQFGEDHTPETHLIPLVLDAATGRRDKIVVFGDDYATPDGTCIRDYIHVRDLATAHASACEKLTGSKAGTSFTVNLGCGHGHSVLDIIKGVQRVTGLDVPYEISDRRPGDPPELVAANGRAHQLLGWTPTHSSLDEIIESAYAWRQKHPAGYPG
jgi:UDP-glucose-4-epimerase GalE